MDFMNHQLTKKCSGKGKVMAMTFEYHELISHNFSLEYNLAKYLPRTFVNEGTIVRGKNINLVVLGYGKTGKAMLKSILLNNQFVEKFGDFYRCKKINVHIYDKNKKQFEEDIMFTHIKNYEALCAENYFNFDQSLGPIEMTAEVFEHVYNVKTDPEGSFYSSIKNQRFWA